MLPLRFRTLIHRPLWFAVGMASLFVSSSVAFAADVSGAWSGRWESSTTGHRGVLRCTLTELDQGRYRADFSGRFLKIVPFRYSVVLDVVQGGDVQGGDTTVLSGQHVLGRRLGTFEYRAEVTGDQFIASYSSCKDCGQFVLERCNACGTRCR